jgi:putative copper resistance protein D
MADPFGIAVRFGLYLGLGLLFGLPAFALQALPKEPGSERSALRLDFVVPALALVAGLLSIAQIILLAASMSGSDLSSVDKATVDAVLSAGSLGVAWKVRMAALLVSLLAALFYRRAGMAALTTGVGASGVALASLAWVGHGTMGDDAAGWFHLGADLVHFLAAGLWLGALVGLTSLVFKPIRSAAHLALCARALSGFARTGTVIVIALLVTGIVNIWTLIGPSAIGTLPATPYGRLLMGKLALFVAMLGLAAANRFRMAPGLARSLDGDAGAAIRHLRISLAIETGCIVAILMLVAWLGMLPPTGDS